MGFWPVAKDAQTRKTVPRPVLRLFVYCTLKKGYWNHQLFCARARSIEPAVVWGRLYHLHAGFPALEVPERLILARGNADPLVDARRQHEIRKPRFGRPTDDWDLIQGERSARKRFTGSFSLPPYLSHSRASNEHSHVCLHDFFILYCYTPPQIQPGKPSGIIWNHCELKEFG